MCRHSQDVVEPQCSVQTSRWQQCSTKSWSAQTAWLGLSGVSKSIVYVWVYKTACVYVFNMCFCACMAGCENIHLRVKDRGGVIVCVCVCVLKDVNVSAQLCGCVSVWMWSSCPQLLSELLSGIYLSTTAINFAVSVKMQWWLANSFLKPSSNVLKMVELWNFIIRYFQQGCDDQKQG